MDLERVAAVIRPRGPWEAVDLGFTMVRAWWRAVYTPWIAAALPVWLAVLLLLRESPGWALFWLWWLKPAFDRLPLYVVSRALFGVVPSARETLRAAHPFRGFFAAVTALRLDPARSFYLPVRQLEGLRGTLLRDRRRVLRGGGQDPAGWLTFACLVMELFLVAAFWGLVAFAVPDTASPRWSELWEGYVAGGSPLWFHLLVGLGCWLAVTLIQPFYVAGGFALYLNRRTLLEGWDVELAFRRMSRRLLAAEAERLRHRSAVAGGGLVAALAVGLLLGAGGPASAGGPVVAAGRLALANAEREADSAPPRTAASAVPGTGAEPDPQEAIAEILAAPEFGSRETVRDWRFRWAPEIEPPADVRGPRVGELLAAVAEVVLWVLAGVLVTVIVIYLIRSRGRWARAVPAGEPPRSAPERRLLSGWIDPDEPLPADVAAAARALLDSGRPLEALSLLYRGALAALDRRPGLSVDESWTEGECLGHLAARLPEGDAGFFRRLTLAWQRAAYAHRRPADDELRRLCGEWPLHFEGAAR